MKKIFYVTIVVLVVCITFFSCEKSEKSENAKKGYTVGVVSAKVKQSLNNIIATHPINFVDRDLTLESKNEFVEEKVDWNYESMRVIQPDGTKESFLMIDNKGYNEKNDINYGLAYYLNTEDSKEVFLTLIIKTKKTGEYTSEVTYFDANGDKCLALAVNSKDKKYEIIYNGESSIEARGHLCSGHDTFACIANTYSANYGWVSVWLWAQSIVIPETCGAVAIHCAYSC